MYKAQNIIIGKEVEGREENTLQMEFIYTGSKSH